MQYRVNGARVSQHLRVRRVEAHAKTGYEFWFQNTPYTRARDPVISTYLISMLRGQRQLPLGERIRGHVHETTVRGGSRARYARSATRSACVCAPFMHAVHHLLVHARISRSHYHYGTTVNEHTVSPYRLLRELNVLTQYRGLCSLIA